MHSNRWAVLRPDAHGGEVQYELVSLRVGQSMLWQLPGLGMAYAYIWNTLCISPTIASLWPFTGEMCLQQPESEEVLHPRQAILACQALVWTALRDSCYARAQKIASFICLFSSAKLGKDQSRLKCVTLLLWYHNTLSFGKNDTKAVLGFCSS